MNGSSTFSMQGSRERVRANVVGVAAKNAEGKSDASKRCGRAAKWFNMFTSEAKLPAITVGCVALLLHPRLFILNRFAALLRRLLASLFCILCRVFHYVRSYLFSAENAEEPGTHSRATAQYPFNAFG
jgi:hypothetical protein